MKDDGGVVYPYHIHGKALDYGITRRDWLAGLAMQARIELDMDTSYVQLAFRSYAIADTLIAEGRKGESSEI